MSDGGKGSGRRPGQGYQDAWDRIFGNKEPEACGAVLRTWISEHDFIDRTCPPCHQDCNQGRNCPAREAVAPHCSASKVQGKVQ
jgi:hypothetical protein